MRKFVDILLHNAEHGCVTPLILGSNVLELKELVKLIARQRGIAPDDIVTVRDRDPRLTTKIRNEGVRGLVIMHGDNMRRDLQMHAARPLKLVLPIVTKTAEELKRENVWIPEFTQFCTQTHRFPAWEERVEDHDELLENMRGLIEQRFELHHAAEYYIRHYDGGTADIFRLLRDAVKIARFSIRDAKQPVLVMLTHLLQAETRPTGTEITSGRSDSSWPAIVLVNAPASLTN